MSMTEYIMILLSMFSYFMLTSSNISDIKEQNNEIIQMLKDNK